MSPRRILSSQMKKFLSSLLLVLICSLSVGCRKYFLTYPYPWDYSKNKPKESDVEGSYEVLDLRLSANVSSKIAHDAQITLKSDGTAVFTDFPEFDLSGEKLVCNLTGSAKWKLEMRKNNGVPWVINFENYVSSIKPVAEKCNSGIVGFGDIVVISRHYPYRLYTTVGDPDNDSGIEFQRSDLSPIGK